MQPDAGDGDGEQRRRRKQPLLGARVCPQGTTAGALNIATAGATPSSMYEPNQFVMNCGVIDPTAGPIRIYSPISRNLNDGDKISPSSVLLLMGRLQLSLSVCAMQSPSIKSQADGRCVDAGQVILNLSPLASMTSLAPWLQL